MPELNWFRLFFEPAAVMTVFLFAMWEPGRKKSDERRETT